MSSRADTDTGMSCNRRSAARSAGETEPMLSSLLISKSAGARDEPDDSQESALDGGSSTSAFRVDVILRSISFSSHPPGGWPTCHHSFAGGIGPGHVAFAPWNCGQP